jgi:predicted MFS family arabinose efflux permease
MPAPRFNPKGTDAGTTGVNRDTSGPGETSLRYEGWRVAAASGVGVFVSFASLLVYTFGVFLKPLAEEFGWSREAVSAAFAIAAMSVAVCSPPLGYLLDRISPRRIIVPCLTIFGCAFASLSLLTPRLWHLYLVFVVLGVVGNGTAQMAYSRAVSSWFERRRGSALAIVMSGGAIGALVLPPTAAALVGRLGWRNASLALGWAVLLIGVPIVARFVRERPRSKHAPDPRRDGAAVGEALRSRVFWIIVTVLFFSSIGQNGAITHVSPLLTDRGLSARDGALAISALGGASLFGRLLTGWLLDRFFAARVSFGLLTAAAIGTFVLSGARSLEAGMLGAALIGIGMGGEADVTPYLLSRYFGLRSFSVLYGLTWTFYAIAGAIGPVLMGKTFDLTGSYEALLVRLALATFAVGSLMLLLPRYTETDSKKATSPALST